MGRNLRHFTYIDDIVNCLLIAMESDLPLLNAANPELITTLQLAEIVSKYKHVEIELVEENRDFDRKEQSVNSHIPTVSLQYTSVSEGIRRIFERE